MQNGKHEAKGQKDRIPEAPVEKLLGINEWVVEQATG